MRAGYYQGNYYPDGYYADTYWPDYSTANVTFAYKLLVSASNGALVVSGSKGALSITEGTSTTKTLVPPVITSQPVNATADDGATATISATVTGSTSLQWQTMPSGGEWEAISGATSNSYITPTLVYATDNGRQYRLIATNADGTTTSDTITLTVEPQTITITAQPANLTVSEGASAAFSVTATGSGITYQWQIKRMSAAWANITDAASSSYSILVTQYDDDNAAQFRCVLTNISGTTTSTAATLTVIEAVSGTIYYVSPTGSGDTYSYAAPGAAKAALTIAVAGDQVVFLDGDYTAADDEGHTGDHAYVAFTPEASGVAGSPIIMKSYNPRGAILKRRSLGTPALGILSHDYITVDGFKTEGAILSTYSSYNIIKNCEVTKGSLVGYDGTGDDSLHWGIGIQVSNSCLIQNNYVHSMDDIGNHTHNGGCIMIYGAGDCFDNVVEYNTVDGSYPNDEPNNMYCAYGTKAGDIMTGIWRYNFAINCYAAFFGIANSADSNYNSGWSIYQNIATNCNVFWYSYDGSRSFNIYNNSGNVIEWTHSPEYFPTDTVRDRDFSYFNNLFVLTSYIVREQSNPDWASLIALTDFNRFSIASYWAAYSGPTLISTLAAWQTASGDEAHSSATAPDFLDADGITPESFKRSAYPTDGRGGDYPAVMGAYITGAERIGSTLA